MHKSTVEVAGYSEGRFPYSAVGSSRSRGELTEQVRPASSAARTDGVRSICNMIPPALGPVEAGHSGPRISGRKSPGSVHPGLGPINDN